LLRTFAYIPMAQSCDLSFAPCRDTTRVERSMVRKSVKLR
jgi:hypothetical protein